MRSSAPEGPIAPRAKQATPSGSSGTTACSAGGQPISQISRAHTAATKNTPSPQHKKNSNHSSGPTSKDSSANRSLTPKAPQKSTTQAHQSNKDTTSAPSSGSSLPPKASHSSENNHQTSSKSRSKSPPTPAVKHGGPPNAKPAAGGKHPCGTTVAPNQANFGEYDDQEWDVGVGHLIIDLDADIAQADRGKMSSSSSKSMNSSMEDKASLKMKIKRTKPPTKTSEAKHVIVKSESIPVGSNSLSQGVVSPAAPQHNGSALRATSETGNPNRTPTTPRNVYKKEKRRPEVNGAVNQSASTPSRTPAMANGPGSPVKDSRPSASNGPVAKKEYPKVTAGTNTIRSPPPSPVAQSPAATAVISQQSNPSTAEKTIDTESTSSQGPAKRIKLTEEKKDACVGTSVGTITEPDFLAPCEPGTAVTLEGIVWHETEGGVLVVNVTWRGKSYVGTLLDCTKHDWAPPRLCDSPASDLDSRTSKGRGKRGRAAVSSTSGTPTAEMSVAETRSGKLRNAVKGRRGGGNGGNRSATPTSNPPSSPAKPELNPLKRKSCAKGDLDVNKNTKRSRFSSSRSTPNNSESSGPGPDQQNSMSENDCEPPPRAPSPKLIECPEPNCSKKYTHINGLKYHQTHAHKETPPADKDSLPRDDKKSISTPSVIEKPTDANIVTKPENRHSEMVTPTDENVPKSPNVIIETTKENEVAITANTPEKLNRIEELEGGDKCKMTLEDSSSTPRKTDAISIGKILSPPLPDTAHTKLPVSQNTIALADASSPPDPSLSRVASLELVNEVACEDARDISHKAPGSPGHSPVGLAASLPAVLSDRNSPPHLSPKEEVNVIKEEDSSVRETRSPAYSDISEADDTAPSIEDMDSKDFKDDKKLDPSLAGPSQFAYGLYYNNYGQSTSPYMMSLQPPSPPSLAKPPDPVDSKECKEVPPANSDYMKIPPHYYYHYSQIYPPGPPGYSNPFARETVYSDDDKAPLKAELKESTVEDTDKGPTDLSRTSSNPARTPTTSDKPPVFNLKDIKSDIAAPKEIESKVPVIDKRHPSELNFRYGGPYDNRGSRLPSPHASNPLPTGHHPPAVSPASNKEDKAEKRPEGVKPTMETTGPPPPPTSSAYYPPFPYPSVGFDPYRPTLVPPLNLAAGFSPYNLPGHPALAGMRYAMLPQGPEDLSRNPLATGFYGHTHPTKLSELHERLQKSPLGQPCSLAKSNSPMAYASSETRMHHPSLLSSSSPSLPISSSIPITSIAPLHHHGSAERKILPHLSLPEGYPYNIMQGGQFPPPHFPPLGLNPVGLGGSGPSYDNPNIQVSRHSQL